LIHQNIEKVYPISCGNCLRDCRFIHGVLQNKTALFPSLFYVWATRKRHLLGFHLQFFCHSLAAITSTDFHVFSCPKSICSPGGAPARPFSLKFGILISDDDRYTGWSQK